MNERLQPFHYSSVRTETNGESYTTLTGPSNELDFSKITAGRSQVYSLMRETFNSLPSTERLRRQAGNPLLAAAASGNPIGEQAVTVLRAAIGDTDDCSSIVNDIAVERTQLLCEIRPGQGLPMACMHCDTPPCVSECPEGATYKRADGIVIQEKDKCIGCELRISACPYGARTLLDDYKSYYPNYGASPQERLGAALHKVGTVEKCTLCAHLIDAGEQPACAQACPASARVTGDLNDPASAVAKLLASRKSRQLQVEKGTKPKVYYLD